MLVGADDLSGMAISDCLQRGRVPVNKTGVGTAKRRGEHRYCLDTASRLIDFRQFVGDVEWAGLTPRRQTRPNPPLHSPPVAARTIAALLTLRDQVIARILAAVRSPCMAANPRTGHAPTLTTNATASICKRSSTI